MPEAQNDEPSFYRPRTLRAWLLGASLLLLAAIAWAIRDDTAGPLREWKTYQRESRAREIARIDSEIESLRRAGGTSAAAAIARLEARKRALSPGGLEGFVRGNPFTDFSAPVLRIEHEDLPKLTGDSGLVRTPRLDRCSTCHAGIDRPDSPAAPGVPPPAPNPLKPHPRLDLFVGERSAHPRSAFGCTICHAGNGEALAFSRASHSPRDGAQAEAWRSSRGWAPERFWDEPQLPLGLVEADCQRCHSNVNEIAAAAPRLAAGVESVRRLGCYGCHEIRGFEGFQKPGPPHDRIAARTPAAWAARWLENPKAFRPRTPMPRFWFLSNSASPADRARAAVEIEAVVAFLYAKSADLPAAPAAPAGDLARGKDLFESVGCLACHTQGEAVTNASFGATWRTLGPDLAALKKKGNPRWLSTWLSDPASLSSTTRMPGMRLAPAEAADLAAYLLKPGPLAVETPDPPRPWTPDDLRAGAAEADKILGEAARLAREKRPDLPAIVLATLREDPHWTQGMDEAAARALILRGLAVEALGRETSPGDAYWEIRGMTDAEARRKVLGERVVSRYGCYGCHRIAGFEGARGIGPSHLESGNKPLERIDFGFLGIPDAPRPGDPAGAEALPPGIPGRVGAAIVPRTRHGYFAQKIADPRSFDWRRERPWLDRLRMPNLAVPPDEIPGLVTVLLGQHAGNADPARAYGPPERRAAAERAARAGDSGIHPDYAFAPAEDARSLVEARTLVAEFGCRGCHSIEGQGAGIRARLAALEGARSGQGAVLAAAADLESPVPAVRTRAAARLQNVVWSRFAPPDLAREGSKARPAWVFGFLQAPFSIRPMVSVRMPSFSLGDRAPDGRRRSFEAIGRGLAALDRRPYPFPEPDPPAPSPEEAEAAREIMRRVNCQACHTIAEARPAPADPTEVRAPDLVRAAARVRPDWLSLWLSDPPALVPGTPMPVPVPKGAPHPGLLGNDRERQIEALRRYLFSLLASETDAWAAFRATGKRP